MINKSALLAVAALSMMASATPSNSGFVMPESGYKRIPGRSGNNRSENSAKRHAKAKVAYKSKRAQRKKSKK